MHCVGGRVGSKVLVMKRHLISNSPTLSGAFSLCCVSIGLVFLAGAGRAIAEPTPAAFAAYNSYVGVVETRLAKQHRSQNGFVAAGSSASQDELRLRRGELIVEQLTPATGVDLPGAMLHHWRGAAYVAGAKVADFERLTRNFNAYPIYFSPQVVEAKVLSGEGDRLKATMRVRQRHVITVVMDTAYDVVFGRFDARHGYSMSRSTRIAEIEGAGTSDERALSSSQEHGFLWRQNTYWSYEERDGGLTMQIESISLTRSIPTGLGWAVGPFVESVPRESLEFTLRSVCNALRK